VSLREHFGVKINLAPGKVRSLQPDYGVHLAALARVYVQMVAGARLRCCLLQLPR
jgi:hypothetical protein